MAACTPASDSVSLDAPQEPNYMPQAESINRGGMGYITPEQAAWLEGLNWPQTYDAMRSTFGLANRSTATADIYIEEGSGREFWVYYDGTTATGFEIK
jgi:hypothetical protein